MELTEHKQQAPRQGSAPQPQVALAMMEGVIKLVAGRKLLVLTGQDSLWATNAVAFPYSPQIGDRILLTGTQENLYMIGVLSEQKHVLLETKGDLTLRSRSGRINIESSESVNIESDALELTSKKYTLTTDTLTQYCSSLKQCIENTLETSAGEMFTAVKNTCRTSAKCIKSLASKTIKIDSKDIKIG